MKLSFTFALCLLFAGFACPPARAANIFVNSSFESGTWGGSQSFANPNDATALFNSNATITGWTTNLGSTWVEEPVHTVDGNRMLWLGPPSVGTVTCISQKLNVSPSGDPTTQLIGGHRYDLSINFAYYDPADPSGANGSLSRFLIYYLLGTTAGGDDPFSQTVLFDLSGGVSAWNTGLGWSVANVGFDMPNITGYDYLKIFVSAPKSTSGSSSRGVLVDNASLTLAPEPGSIMLLLGSLVPVLRRRRR